MISDGERREVARRMRMLSAREHLSTPVLAATIGCECSDDAHLWNRLADLIDPDHVGDSNKMVDRDALLALADECDEMRDDGCSIGSYELYRIARRIREACGERRE